MRYQITDITPIGGDRDVLVELAYWYDDNALPTADPDLVSHLLIVNLPTPRPVPRANELGQWVRADDGATAPFVEVDGEWRPWMPQPGDPDHVFDMPDVDDAQVLLTAIDEHIDEVAAMETPIIGDERYPKDHPDRPVRSTRVSHMANRGAVRSLIGRTRRR